MASYVSNAPDSTNRTSGDEHVVTNSAALRLENVGSAGEPCRNESSIEQQKGTATCGPLCR